MRELTIEETKNIELNLLKNIDSLCRKKGYKYSLAGGTALGCIRHKGFIPWDDDIDILMPRKDYEEFLKFCHDNIKEFDVLACEFDNQYSWLNAKICDSNTYLNEDTGFRMNYKEGVYVDVFPIDGAGTTYREAIKNFKKQRFNLELLNAANWEHYIRSKTRSWIFEPIRFVFFILSRFVNPNKLSNKIENRIKKLDMQDNSYSCCYSGSYREKEVLPTSVFEEYIELPFEDGKFMIFKEYDKYLGSIYGNYMDMPPENKRVSHHGFTAYRKEEK